MFCPSCGLEERNANQYCRACGTDLRLVRFSLEKPDNITQSAVSARDEIGRAFAQRIRETQDAIEMKIVAEDVLPKIEKFLESPEEKRLRRIRSGVVTASVGLGAVIGFSLAAIFADKGVFVMAGAGMIAFFIGLGIIINGMLLTIPKKSLSDKSNDAASQRQLDVANPNTNELILPEGNREIFSSVTEHTTHQLKKKEPIPRK